MNNSGRLERAQQLRHNSTLRRMRISLLTGSDRSEAWLRRVSQDAVDSYRAGDISESEARELISEFVRSYIEVLPDLAAPSQVDLRNDSITISTRYIMQQITHDRFKGKKLKSWLDLDRINTLPQWIRSIINSTRGHPHLLDSPKIEATSIDNMTETFGDRLPIAMWSSSPEYECVYGSESEESRRATEILARGVKRMDHEERRAVLCQFLKAPKPRQGLSMTEAEDLKFRVRQLGGWNEVLSRNYPVSKVRALLPVWTKNSVPDSKFVDIVERIRSLEDSARIEQACELLMSPSRRSKS